MPDECCGKCRFWLQYDSDPERGCCRRYPPVVIDIDIEAMFELCDAISENGLCANDLAEGIRLAVNKGHETAIIGLLIMVKALNIDLESKDDAKPNLDHPTTKTDD